MKVTKYIAAIIFAAACSVTLAQDEYYFPTISKVTFKIKETYTVPDLKAKDSDGNKIPGTARVYNNYYTQLTKEGFVNVEEFGTKTRTFKISNKVILEALYEAFIIDSIQGWYFVYIESLDGNYLAVTNGSTLIDLVDIIDINLGEDADISGFAVDSFFKDTPSKSIGYYKVKGTVVITFDFDVAEAYMQGIFKSSGKVKKFGKGEGAFYPTIPSKGKISSISGALYQEDADENSVLEGSIEFSKAKLAPGALLLEK